ncbi:MAG: stage II sporulation protein M [Ruminiclostridium sp.]|nr:stage II sporulation protein M [Ruminiclostridium sp.]
MNEASFINTHKDIWQELETTLRHLPGKRKKSEDFEIIHRLLFLYQSSCEHLSVARTRYGNTSTVDYLNNLVARAHQSIYVTKPNSFSRLTRFLINGFPALLKQEKRLVLISTGIFAFFFFFSFLFTVFNENYALSFVPAEYVNAIKGNNQQAATINYSVASVFIFTNNIRVGILAFALGITFGVGTVYVLATNGLLLGALAAVAFNSGNSYNFWSLIVPHGVPELFCIFVCGGAGLLIARSMLFPKTQSRRSSFIEGGRKAIFLLIGTIPLFILAGLTEGYFTPLPIDPIYKYIGAAFWLLLLSVYIFLKRKTVKKSSFI